MLIHPDSRYRNLLISALIDNPVCRLFYYGLGIEDITLTQFVSGLSRCLADQVGIFGVYVNEELGRGTTDPGTLAGVFARDLALLDADDYLLILDEYDRADPIADIHNFVERLLDFLPAQCHLLIGSRTVPRLPWVALVARRQAVILRDARMLSSGFYSRQVGEYPL